MADLQLIESPPGRGLEHGPYPDDCQACNRPGNYRRPLTEGVPCLLTVEDGTASVRCAACGAEMWLDGDSIDYQMEVGLPVVLKVRDLCTNGGMHFDHPGCDCGVVVDITVTESPDGKLRDSLREADLALREVIVRMQAASAAEQRERGTGMACIAPLLLGTGLVPVAGADPQELYDAEVAAQARLRARWTGEAGA